MFIDTENVISGERFDLKLKEVLANTDVFLAVIGPRWAELLEARAHGGERDFVREEIAAALEAKLIVIPVIMDGAPMPAATSMTGDIRELALHHKHDVAHLSWRFDVEVLMEIIKARRDAQKEKGNRDAQKMPNRKLGVAFSSVCAIALLCFVWKVWQHMPEQTLPPSVPQAKVPVTPVRSAEAPPYAGSPISGQTSMQTKPEKRISESGAELPSLLANETSCHQDLSITSEDLLGEIGATGADYSAMASYTFQQFSRAVFSWKDVYLYKELDRSDLNHGKYFVVPLIRQNSERIFFTKNNDGSDNYMAWPHNTDLDHNRAKFGFFVYIGVCPSTSDVSFVSSSRVEPRQTNNLGDLVVSARARDNQGKPVAFREPRWVRSSDGILALLFIP